MFEDSLFATNPRPAQRREWATAMSFGIQAVMLTMLVMLPLYYTDALPLGALKNYVEVPLPPAGHAPEPQQPVHARPHTASTSNYVDNRLVQPTEVPSEVTQLDERNVVPGPPSPYDVPYAVGGPNGNNRMNQLLASNMRVACR